MSAPVVFKIPLYIVALPILVTLIAGPVGLLLFRRIATRQAGLFLILAALLAIPFAPAMYADRVVVTPTEIYQTTGLPWAPTRNGFAFKDVSSVSVNYHMSHSTWDVSFRDGTEQTIDPGDLWDAHTYEIIALLKKRGVTVLDKRD